MKIVSNNVFFAWVETEISEGRSVRFRLKGESMLPLIRGDRDDVVLYPCSPYELKPMDVVLFRYKGRHLLHRIIERENENLVLQGDGSFVAKEECMTHDVVGKVHFVVRENGKVVSVESWKWRFKSWLWCKLTPFRTILLRITRLIL